MWETIVGGLMGGLFRIAPELLKWLDRKNERAHELAMQGKAYEFEKLRGENRQGEITVKGQVDWNTGALDALKEAIAGQGKRSGIKWVDAFSSMMRPIITCQWVILLYPGIIVTTFYLYIDAGIPVTDALLKVFGPDEKAICAAILNFWFLGRVFDRVR